METLIELWLAVVGFFLVGDFIMELGFSLVDWLAEAA